MQFIVVSEFVDQRKILSDMLWRFASRFDSKIDSASSLELLQKKLELKTYAAVFYSTALEGESDELEVLSQEFSDTSFIRVGFKANTMGQIDYFEKVTESVNAPVVLDVQRLCEELNEAVQNEEAQAFISDGSVRRSRHSILLIGCSTGGPDALRKVIPRLPPDLPVPVLVVQHIMSEFSESLASDLDRMSKITVREAQEGREIIPGEVLIAPGDVHLKVASVKGIPKVRFGHEAPVQSVRPSVDVLFTSVAKNFSYYNVLAVVLTGIGKDGVDGVQALKENTCYCITQTPENCVAEGMPKSVCDAGLSDECADIENIADVILNRIEVS